MGVLGRACWWPVADADADDADGGPKVVWLPLGLKTELVEEEAGRGWVVGWSSMGIMRMAAVLRRRMFILRRMSKSVSRTDSGLWGLFAQRSGLGGADGR